MTQTDILNTYISESKGTFTVSTTVVDSIVQFWEDSPSLASTILTFFFAIFLAFALSSFALLSMVNEGRDRELMTSTALVD